VNGVSSANRVQGEGPPLVLIMGYRLNSAAWPRNLVANLRAGSRSSRSLKSQPGFRRGIERSVK
jgi:pimeloyl-ACP methyl ester carboxylesterase